MPDAELVNDVAEAALRLIEESASGEVDGEDVARAVGRDPDETELYYALREAQRRGDVECVGWRGGMGLPAFVTLP